MREIKPLIDTTLFSLSSVLLPHAGSCTNFLTRGLWAVAWPSSSSSLSTVTISLTLSLYFLVPLTELAPPIYQSLLFFANGMGLYCIKIHSTNPVYRNTPELKGKNKQHTQESFRFRLPKLRHRPPPHIASSTEDDEMRSSRPGPRSTSHIRTAAPVDSLTNTERPSALPVQR